MQTVSGPQPRQVRRHAARLYVKSDIYVRRYGDTAMSNEFDFNSALKIETVYDPSDRFLEAFYTFAGMVNSIRNDLEGLNPTQLLDRLLKEVGYKEHLLTTAANKEEGESRWENVQELKTVTQKFQNLRGVEALQTLLEDIALVSDQDELEESDNGVKLMTIHAAKGLEFSIVFVVGMEEGIFPHSRSLINPSEMEEERRLCYVAMTRAIDRLYMLFASQRMRYGNVQVNPPSRFLDDIPGGLTDWRT